MFRPSSKEHPEDETFDGLLILRPEGRIFFANAEQIAHKVRMHIQETRPDIVILDLSAVFDLEYTALKMLIEAEKKNRERGIRLWLVGMNPEVLSMIKKSSLEGTLGREGMHFNLETALTKYLRESVATKAG